ncbi:MAG: DUF2023 family protein [Fusobacteriaceae bacterium]|jgi:hypothetical protein|nr:DUF2023 family protein [Fusobacteriaceae bacterium]
MSINEQIGLSVFFHMLYELNKGLRTLSLLTTSEKNVGLIMEQLEKCKYDSIVETLQSGYVNIFFGKPDSVNVIRSFRKTTLRDFTLEEDFILGVLLGYNKDQQCKRYLTRKSGRAPVESQAAAL